MAVKRDIITGNGMPETWVDLFQNKPLAIRNVSIDTVGITNATDLGTNLRLRVGDTVIFARSAPANATTTYTPDIILGPGDLLQGQADSAGRVDLYAVGRRDTAFNRFGMYLMPNVPEEPVLIYEHPLHAGRDVLIHTVVASRTEGSQPAEVNIYAHRHRTDADITLLAARVNVDNFTSVAADYIIQPGDTIWASAEMDRLIDLCIVWEIRQ
jgi:hypothetical protein